MRKVLKVLLFLIASVFIGYIPAFICVFAGSWLLLLFGIVIADTTGNIILWILTICLGIYLVADVIEKK